jgi:RES domain-containing protein
MVHGARFTPKGSFSSIYLASDPITALMEIVSVFDHPNWARSSPPRAVPWTLFTVDGVVANLIDLAEAETQELLGTNEQELSGIWLTVDMPATQVLGQAAYSDGSIAGIRYRSAKNHSDGFCVVIFEDRLGLSSHNYLEVYDPSGRLNQRLP